MGHTDILQLLQDFFSLLTGMLQKWKAGRMEREMSASGMHDVKFTKNQ